MKHQAHPHDFLPPMALTPANALPNQAAQSAWHSDITDGSWPHGGPQMTKYSHGTPSVVGATTDAAPRRHAQSTTATTVFRATRARVPTRVSYKSVPHECQTKFGRLFSSACFAFGFVCPILFNQVSSLMQQCKRHGGRKMMADVCWMCHGKCSLQLSLWGDQGRAGRHTSAGAKIGSLLDERALLRGYLRSIYHNENTMQELNRTMQQKEVAEKAEQPSEKRQG